MDHAIRRVAVTGASGTVGGAVARTLLARGLAVINLDRRPCSDPAIPTQIIDLRERDEVHRALAEVDAVCHLGEIPNLCGLPPAQVFADNTAIGANVFQAAADLKLKRVVYASSIQYYGFCGSDSVVPHHLPVDEDHPATPRTAYGQSKQANEGYARLVARWHGLSIAALRLPWICDWALDGSHDLSFLDSPTATASELGSYLHLHDAASAFAAALLSPRPGFEAYNVVAPNALTNRPLVDVMRAAHPEYPPLPAGWPSLRCPYCDDKFRAHTGWQPTIDLVALHRRKALPTTIR
jgi:nucleoside-diphosphate-sugar epimerase